MTTISCLLYTDVFWAVDGHKYLEKTYELFPMADARSKLSKCLFTRFANLLRSILNIALLVGRLTINLIFHLVIIFDRQLSSEFPVKKIATLIKFK